MKTVYTILTLLLMILAPLVGAQWAGYAVDEFIKFPPMTTEVTIAHAEFSWFVFFGLVIFILILVTPFFRRVLSQRNIVKKPVPSRYGFPSWGWAGIFIILLSWFIAWTRMPWMESLQTFTFSPLWLGYILLINALTFYRSGRSLVTHQPKFIIALFLVSAVFWWYFEFINQFVENWHYINVGELSDWQFFWYATLPFSTVLPAVISTRDYLKTIPGFSAGLNNYITIPKPGNRFLTHVVLIASTLALGAISIYPNYLFPLLWLAPLLIIATAVALTGRKTILSGIFKGQWKEIFLLGMAALVCGFFWEMWNFYSYTRWAYSIPFVDRFHIFEMPLLGYAGYIPFGLQCGLVAAWVQEWFK